MDIKQRTLNKQKEIQARLNAEAMATGELKTVSKQTVYDTSSHAVSVPASLDRRLRVRDYDQTLYSPEDQKMLSEYAAFQRKNPRAKTPENMGGKISPDGQQGVSNILPSFALLLRLTRVYHRTSPPATSTCM